MKKKRRNKVGRPAFTWKEVLQAFWNKVSIPQDQGSCWLWLASTRKGGYGAFSIGRTPIYAHVFMWRYILKRPLKLQVCHECDVGGCVNPNHLYEASQSQNILDAYRRGRIKKKKGVANQNVKLNDKLVRLMRRMLAKGYTYKDLASVFDVVPGTVRLIDRGEIWTHITLTKLGDSDGKEREEDDESGDGDEEGEE